MMEGLMEAALGPEVVYWRTRGVTCEDVADTVASLHNVAPDTVRVVLIRNNTWRFLMPARRPSGITRAEGGGDGAWTSTAANLAAGDAAGDSLRALHAAISGRLHARWAAKRYDLPDMVLLLNTADNMQRYGLHSRAPILSLQVRRFVASRSPDLPPGSPRSLTFAPWRKKKDVDVRLVRPYTHKPLGSRSPFELNVTLPAHPPTPISDHARYRWLLNVDGLAGSSRMGLLMTTDSAILKSRSPFIEYYSRLQLYARAALLAYHSLVPDMGGCVRDLVKSLEEEGEQQQ
eukprot:XP_001700129.1 predicted protein [Chlamydomonas reinhardtii]